MLFTFFLGNFSALICKAEGMGRKDTKIKQILAPTNLIEHKSAHECKVNLVRLILVHFDLPERSGQIISMKLCMELFQRRKNPW